MGRVKDYWMEQISDCIAAYHSKQISHKQALARLKELNVDDEDIDEYIGRANDEE